MSAWPWSLASSCTAIAIIGLGPNTENRNVAGSLGYYSHFGQKASFTVRYSLLFHTAKVRLTIHIAYRFIVTLCGADSMHGVETQ
jgi:hypothetical protein